jgi:hypothetical protein
MDHGIYKKGMTRLGYACYVGDVSLVQTLLELGANPDGITPTGLSYINPIGALHNVSSIETFKGILDLLLRYGADIHLTGLNDIPILFWILHATYSYEKGLYLLQRGANPNGTIVYHPACYILRSKLYEKPTYLKLLHSLIDYGLDLYGCDMLQQTPHSLLPPSFAYTPLPSSLKLIHGNPKKVIPLLYKYKDDLNFEEIRNRRKLRMPVFHNDTTLMGNDVYEFTMNELLVLKEGEYTWAFHRYDIPYLRQTKKNPYTNQSFPLSFVDALFSEHVLPEHTLEEVLCTPPSNPHPSNIQSYAKTRIASFVKTVNTYVDYAKLASLPPFFLNEILELLHLSIRISSFDEFNKLVYTNLTRNLLSLPLFVYAIDQTLDDYSLGEDVKEALGDFFQYVKNDLPNISFAELLQWIPHASTHIHQQFFKRSVDVDELWNVLRLRIPHHP